MKKILSVVLVILVGFIAFDFVRPLNDVSLVKGVLRHMKNEPAPLGSPDSGAPEGFSVERAPVEVEFKSWVEREGQEVEKSSGDPQAQESQLRLRAQKITLAEAQYLKDLVLTEQSSAGQKIFAVYFLTLATGLEPSILWEIVASPSKYGEIASAHSPEETLAMQERALRRMALDSLLERAERDSEYRSELEHQVRQLSDEALRKYAMNRLTQREK